MKKQSDKFVSKEAEALWNKLHGITKTELQEDNKKIEIEISKKYNISTRKKN